MKRIIYLFIIFMAVFLEPEILKWSVNFASSAPARILKIGIIDCIAYALKNNSDIKIERIEPKIKEDDVRIEKADFEPELTVDYSLRDNVKESGTALSGATVSRSRDVDVTAGVSGKLVTGTEYDIDFIHEKIKSNSSYQSLNPSYTVEPKVTITQPLFKDSGVFVNKADIIISRNNKTIAEEDFKNSVADIIGETEIAYYNCIYQAENYSIAALSLKRSRDLLEINNVRYTKGLISQVDLLETETASLQKERLLISREADLRKAEDKLKLITNIVEDSKLWDAELDLLDKPQFSEKQLHLEKCMENAFNFRYDYKSAKIDLENKDIKVKVAKNGLLPVIDLSGSFGLNGLGRDFDKAIDNIDSKYRDWSMGVEVSIPWGGEERATYDKRKLEKAQALIAFKKLEQDIVLEIRDRVREVDIQSRQVKAATVSREKEQENYRAQGERYKAGEISTHDMLDYQDKLSQAELDYIKALIDYNIALIELEKSQGLTLLVNNIKLEE